MRQALQTDYAALEGPLTPGSPLWSWAYQGITERANKMLEHLEGVRAGEDIEEVHDMRVGSRRLVAAMRVFGDCFPGKPYRRLVREARDVTRALGGVRDLDVLIDHYQKLRSPEDPEAMLGIDYFIAVQQRARRKVRKPLLVALEALEKGDFPVRVARFLREEAELYATGLHAAGGRPDDGAPVDCRRPFAAMAPSFLRQRYDEFYAFEPYVGQPEAVYELHEMRIKAKWLRYTMELFAPAYADALKPVVSVVKKFQEHLGDLHDSDVRLDILREMLAHPLDARGLEALGLMLPEPVVAGLRVLLEREEAERARIYAAFYKEWKKCEKRGFRQACLEAIQSPLPV